MSGCVFKHSDFLSNIYRNPIESIVRASSKEIQFFVECIYNILANQKIKLTKREYSVLSREIKILTKISKIRVEKEARTLLKTLSPVVLKTLARSILSVSGCLNVISK